MKRTSLFLILLALALHSVCFAASSCTVSTSASQDIFVTTFTWTASETDGSFTATASSWPASGDLALLLEVVTDPGATAPTALYDITLTDANGNDIAYTALNNRSATVTEQVKPDSYFSGPLTLNITNNSVVSATGVVYVYFQKKWDN